MLCQCHACASRRKLHQTSSQRAKHHLEEVGGVLELGGSDRSPLVVRGSEHPGPHQGRVRVGAPLRFHGGVVGHHVPQARLHEHDFGPINKTVYSMGLTPKRVCPGWGVMVDYSHNNAEGLSNHLCKDSIKGSMK